MRISILFISLFIPSILLRADTLDLAGHSRLSGEIQSIDSIQKGGYVSLLQPDSAEPIRLKSEFVQQVIFSPQTDNIEGTSHHVTLRTGEKLPCRILSLSADILRVSTDYAGELDIHKKHIAQVSFGSKATDAIYQGPNSTNEWEYMNDWIYQSGSLISRSKAVAYQSFELPENFSVSFRLTWQDPPKFKFYFCTDSRNILQKQNRYMLFFDSSGIELKRVTPRTNQGIAAIQRRPDSFPNKTAFIELKVDRSSRQISLAIDGEEIGTFLDRTDKTPLGDGIIFESTPRFNGATEVSDITIRKWDGLNALSQKKRVISTQLDTIYVKNGQSFSGQALTIQQLDNKKLSLSFEVPHANEMMQVPFTELEKLFFSNHSSEAAPKTPTSIRIELNQSGELFISDISLENGIITAKHPALGNLTINLGSIAAIQNNRVLAPQL